MSIKCKKVALIMRKHKIRSRLSIRLGIILATILMFSIIFLREQRTSAGLFSNKWLISTDNELLELENSIDRFLALNVGERPDENISEVDRRINQVVLVKVKNLLDIMKTENMRESLKNFYLKGERKYSIVLSKWRSGSSFFGDFLQSVPGTFYHYEPLINKINILEAKKVSFGLERVKNFLQCNYSNVPDFFGFMKNSRDVFKNAVELKNVYTGNEDIAITEKFVTSVCKAFPYQNTKVIRLKLDNFREILEHNELDIKIVLLVRDPRAVMNSRKSLSFCQNTVDCKHPSILCEHMVRDFYAAKVFAGKFPNNLRVVRYEDMMLNLIPMSKRLLKFYELPYTEKTESFLKEHTSKTDHGPFSTFRDPNITMSRWMKKLNFKEVTDIQLVCTEAMKLWGYQSLSEEEFNQKSINPTLPFNEFNTE